MKKLFYVTFLYFLLLSNAFSQELVERRLFIESKSNENAVDQYFQSFTLELLKTEALALNALVLVDAKKDADVLLTFTYTKANSNLLYTLELVDLIQSSNSFTYSDTIKSYLDEAFLENIKIVFFQKTAKAIVKIPQKIREELTEKTVTQIEYKDTSTGISANIIGVPKTKLYFFDGTIKEIPENGKLELKDIPQNTDLIFTAKNNFYFDLPSETHLGYTDTEIKIAQIPIPRFSISSSIGIPLGIDWSLEYLVLPEGLTIQAHYLNTAYPQIFSISQTSDGSNTYTTPTVHSQKIEFSANYNFFKPNDFFQFKLGAGFYTLLDTYKNETQWSKVVPIAFTTDIKPELYFFREFSIFLSWKPSLILFSRAIPTDLLPYNSQYNGLSEIFGDTIFYNALIYYNLLALGLPNDLNAAYNADPNSVLYTENTRYNYLSLLSFTLGATISF